MDFLFDFYRTLRFATRLPLPVLAREEADPIVCADAFAPAFTVSGLVVGSSGTMVLALAHVLSLAPLMSAVLAVAAMVLVTGALHEDGLADCADGLGGGRTRERKLEIMRDSAIGTYGVLALVVSIAFRVAAVAAVLGFGLWAAVGTLLATQTLSRAMAMLVASHLPHARTDGAAARLGQPSSRAAVLALVIAGAASLLVLGVSLGLLPGIAALVLALSLMSTTTLVVGRIAQRHIGGQTGDVLGASQQLSDLAGLLGLTISMSMLS